MAYKKPLPNKEIKILWGRSHNTCAICKIMLTEDSKENEPYSLGVMAHIEGELPGSARYNTNLDYPEKNKYDNLILLCPTCHTKIDNDLNTFTVEKLKQIKKEHEQWGEQAIKNLIPDITYIEIETILNFIIKGKSKEEKNKLITIPPSEKIKKNNLTTKTEDFIRMGLSQFTTVKNFINDYPDINFSDNLKNIFISKYIKLKDKMNGDELFFALWDFACGNTNEFNYRTAGLVVLSYFFQQCDVFEL